MSVQHPISYAGEIAGCRSVALFGPVEIVEGGFDGFVHHDEFRQPSLLEILESFVRETADAQVSVAIVHAVLQFSQHAQHGVGEDPRLPEVDDEFLGLPVRFQTKDSSVNKLPDRSF